MNREMNQVPTLLGMLGLLARHPLLLSLVIFQLSACTGVRESLLSRPIENNTTQITRAGRIDTDDFRLYIRPANQVIVGKGVNWFGIVNNIDPYRQPYWYSEYFSPRPVTIADPVYRFYIEFFIETQRELSIDPTKITLTTNNTKALGPSSYLAPLSLHSTSNYTLTLCQPDLNLEKPTTLTFSIPENKSMCFALAYDVAPPLPTEKFRLEITGLRTTQTIIKLPPIFFDGNKETSFHP